jgi:predicted nuclease of predicted toxin-antitoxin system
MATFFFDNDVSFRIARALAQLVHGHEIVALRDRFPTDTPDVVWIPEAGRNGWIVISRDHNQRRRDAEHRALIDNRVTAIYIRSSGTPDLLFTDAARIIRNWPRIEAWASTSKPGSLARLGANDRIEPL